MRLTNFVIDIKTATVASGSYQFKVDSQDPATRQTINNIYPWGGDVKHPIHACANATQIDDGNDSVHLNVMIEGDKRSQNMINNNSTMKLTGSLAAQPEPGAQYEWGILMVADSEFKG